LVDAIEPLLKRWDMRFLLAVTYGPEERVLERIRDHPRVSIFGYVDPYRIYNSSDLVVLPRRFLAGSVFYPNVMLEAMSCATPVLISRLPGMEDVIEDGVNGFFFSPNDPESLRRKIEEIASDRDRLEKVGSNARKTVLERFSCTENLKKIEELLEDEARG
jgi:glycosyltransferase involved in cell wall biosynthesis